MTTLRRAIAGAALLALFVAGLVAAPAVAQTTDAESVDIELVRALETVGFVDEFVGSAQVDSSLATLRFDGGTSLADARASIIEAASQLEAEIGENRALLSELSTLDDLHERTLVVARTMRRVVQVDREQLDLSDIDVILKELSTIEIETSLAATHDAARTLEGALERLTLFVLDSGTPRVEAPNFGARKAKQPRVDDLEDALSEIAAAGVQLEGLELAANILTPRQSELRDQLVAAIDEYHSAVRSAIAPIDGLPVSTIDAYVSAERFVDDGCSVDWQLLAGIGRIESLHGTLDGSSVALDGRVSPRVFGPLLDGGILAWEAEQAARDAQAEQDRIAAEEEAEQARLEAALEAQQRELFGDLYQPTPTPTLEEDLLTPVPTPTPPPLFEPRPTPTPTPDLWGRMPDPVDEPESGEEAEEESDEIDGPLGNGFALIYDTDGGALDGNDRFDRAVGPMQFIPGTWRLFATDGNADGVVDPHNLYDATASAAGLLCHLERRNGYAPASTFVRGYNDSASYVADVLETRERLLIWELLDGAGSNGA